MLVITPKEIPSFVHIAFGLFIIAVLHYGNHVTALHEAEVPLLLAVVATPYCFFDC